MDSWTILGIFLFGAGAGSIVSAMLHSEQIRNLKDLMEGALHNNSRADEQLHKSDNRSNQTTADPPKQGANQ
jgi:hypothetical protein